MITGSKVGDEPEFSAKKRCRCGAPASLVGQSEVNSVGSTANQTRPLRPRSTFGLAPKAWPRRLVLLRVLGRDIERDRPTRQEDRERVLGELPAILVVVRAARHRNRRHLFLLLGRSCSRRGR